MALVKIVPLFFFIFGAFATIEDAKDGKRKFVTGYHFKIGSEKAKFFQNGPSSVLLASKIYPAQPTTALQAIQGNYNILCIIFFEGFCIN